MDSRFFGTAGFKGCKFNCIYCFTNGKGYVRPPRLDLLKDDELVQSIGDCTVIQPSCDTDIFLVKDWQSYLKRLSNKGKSISFATKATLNKVDFAILKELNEKLSETDNILHIGVTIVKLDKWNEIELNAHSPYERIETLKNLHEHGIATSVLFRPLLPNLQKSEIDEIISLTYKYTDSYIAGPLYLNEKMKEYLKAKEISIPTFYREADWMVNKPNLEAYYDKEIENYIKKQAHRFKIPFFENNLDAVVFSKMKKINSKIDSKVREDSN